MGVFLDQDNNITAEQKLRKFLFLAIASLNVFFSGVLGPVFIRRGPEYSDAFLDRLASYFGDALVQQFIGLGATFVFALVYFSALWVSKQGKNEKDTSKWFALEKNPLYSAARYAGFVFLFTLVAFLAVFLTIFLMTAFHISIPILLWILIMFSFPFFKGVFKL